MATPTAQDSYTESPESYQFQGGSFRPARRPERGRPHAAPKVEARVIPAPPFRWRVRWIEDGVEYESEYAFVSRHAANEAAAQVARGEGLPQTHRHPDWLADHWAELAKLDHRNYRLKKTDDPKLRRRGDLDASSGGVTSVSGSLTATSVKSISPSLRNRIISMKKTNATLTTREIADEVKAPFPDVQRVLTEWRRSQK